MQKHTHFLLVLCWKEPFFLAIPDSFIFGIIHQKRLSLLGLVAFTLGHYVLYKDIHASSSFAMKIVLLQSCGCSAYVVQWPVKKYFENNIAITKALFLLSAPNLTRISLAILVIGINSTCLDITPNIFFKVQLNKIIVKNICASRRVKCKYLGRMWSIPFYICT